MFLALIYSAAIAGSSSDFLVKVKTEDISSEILMVQVTPSLSSEVYEFQQTLAEVKACASQFPNYAGISAKVWPDPFQGPFYKATVRFISNAQATLQQCIDHPNIDAQNTTFSTNDLEKTAEKIALLLGKESHNLKGEYTVGSNTVKNKIVLRALKKDREIIEQIVIPYNHSNIIWFDYYDTLKVTPSVLYTPIKNSTDCSLTNSSEHPARVERNSLSSKCPIGSSRSYGVCVID